MYEILNVKKSAWHNGTIELASVRYTFNLQSLKFSKEGDVSRRLEAFWSQVGDLKNWKDKVVDLTEENKTLNLHKKWEYTPLGKLSLGE